MSAEAPIPMRLPCPACGELHIDEGEFATKPHATHACQECGLVWRPALVNTVGVRFLPGYRNDAVEQSIVTEARADLVEELARHFETHESDDVVATIRTIGARRAS